MLSRKITITTRLVLVALITVSHTKSATAESVKPSIEDRIYITDYDGHRKINYKDQQLLIYTGDKYKASFYRSKNFVQSYIEIGNKKEWSFQVESKSRNHLVVLRDNQVKYYSADKSIHYFACAESLFKEITDAKFDDIIETVSNQGLKKLLDSSCSDNENFTDVYEKIFAYETDNINSCHKPLLDFISDKDGPDRTYFNYLGKFYSDFYQFTKEIETFALNPEEAKKPLTIRCESIPNNELASMNSKTNPKTITFNIEQIEKKIKDKTENSNDQTAAYSKILRHELFHKGQPQQETSSSKIDVCINEAMTTVFSEFCSLNTTKKIIKEDGGSSKVDFKLKLIPSKDIIDACNKDPEARVSIKEDGNINLITKAGDINTSLASDTSKLVAGTQANQSAANQKLAAATEQNLQSVTVADFIPTDTVFALNERKIAGATKGVESSIPPRQAPEITSAFAAARKSEFTNIRSYNSSAVAAASTLTGNRAIASVRESNNTTSERTAPKSAQEKTNRPTTTNNQNTPTASVASKNTNTDATSGANTQVPSLSAASTSTAIDNLATTTTAASTATRTPASTTTTPTASTTSASTPVVESKTTPAPTRQPAAINNQNAPEVAIARSFRNINTRTGASYDSVRALYNNPTFKETLYKERIRIDVLDKNGNQLLIGGRPVRIGYVDDKLGPPARVFQSSDSEKRLQSIPSN